MNVHQSQKLGLTVCFGTGDTFSHEICSGCSKTVCSPCSTIARHSTKDWVVNSVLFHGESGPC